MNIQSLSIVVPTHGCMNQCKFCVSRMHKEEYKDLISDADFSLRNAYKNRMAFARDNGCNTVMLTGQGEPQQNMAFIREFTQMNSELAMPFRNIEIQTTGTNMVFDTFKELATLGVTTVSLSVSCLMDNATNAEVINKRHTPIDLGCLCGGIKNNGMNLRLSLNMTQWLFPNMINCCTYEPNPYPSHERIFDFCAKGCHADQVTFRRMYTDGNTETPQSKWINENNIQPTDKWFKELNEYIVTHGRYLDTLEYGSKRYSVMGMSTVVDEDCMAKSEEKKALKYLILRPNCKLYTQWDDKGSLLF